MGLEPREQRFVDEYMIDLNATAAARRAGYSAHTARQIGSENLSKPDIKGEIERRMAERATACEVSAEEVVRELKYIAFADLGELLDFSEPIGGGWFRLKDGAEIPPEARRAIAQIKTKMVKEGGGDEARDVLVTEFKLWPKTDALKTLAMHLGMLIDRKRVEGADGKTLLEMVVEAMGGDDRGPERVAATD